jgi:hypothetical protein
VVNDGSAEVDATLDTQIGEIVELLLGDHREAATGNASGETRDG